LNGALTGTGTPLVLSPLTPPVTNGADDATEGSLNLATVESVASGQSISSGYSHSTANSIANPQIPNEGANLSTKYECRVVYTIGTRTFSAAKEIITITA
jgi:hypothetical protein